MALTKGVHILKVKGQSAAVAQGSDLEVIKRAAIVAMFSDEDLMDLLVLKGGNAMDMVHQANARASVDLDFSTAGDLDHKTLVPKLEKALTDTFELHKYLAFDIKVGQKPGVMPDDLAAFWGGYLVEFKLIRVVRADEVGRDLEIMRREAVRLGDGSRFTIDISRHEYVDGKEEHELDGYVIFVYSPEMIVCEKLRAICQQMPEYAEIIKRNGLGKQRARDFIDIRALVEKFEVDLSTARAQEVVRAMFEAKKVPLGLLAKIGTTSDFHALGFDEVKAAMKPGVKVESFDFYFDFVVTQCKKLEALWNVQAPMGNV